MVPLGRRGKFRLAESEVHSFSPVIRRIFCEAAVINARSEGDTVIYTAISPHFRELSEGERIPEYVFEFSGLARMVVRELDQA